MSATLGAGLPSTALPVPKGWAQASFNLCIVLPILAGFAVAGRFYLRRLQRFRPGVDDWLVLAALVSASAPSARLQTRTDHSRWTGDILGTSHCCRIRYGASRPQALTNKSNLIRSGPLRWYRIPYQGP